MSKTLEETYREVEAEENARRQRELDRKMREYEATHDADAEYERMRDAEDEAHEAYIQSFSPEYR